MPYVGVVDLNVTSFNSPLRGDMRSSQTKRAKHHFPIKSSQQSLQLQAIFTGWEKYRAMQDFVRKHHVRSLSTVESPEVTIYWPERGMDNWTGIIQDFKAGDERFNIAPRASIDILLVDSMLSQKTWTSSFGQGFDKFFETDIGDPIFTPPVNYPGTGIGVVRPGDDGFIGPVSPIRESPRGEGGTGGTVGGGGGNF